VSTQLRTQVTTTRTDLPPPTRHLLHDERPIGWLAGTTFGFVGFADAREAANAAWVAYRTVSRKVAPLLGVRPTPIDIEPLSIESRDGREMILASGRPVAALVRPDPESPGGRVWFGFAIEVSPAIGERMMPAIMRAAGHALLKSGIRWSMIRPRPRKLACASQDVAHNRSAGMDRRRAGRRGRRGADIRYEKRRAGPLLRTAAR
jgi:hypothetical protein